jgi:hypothetical protein
MKKLLINAAIIFSISLSFSAKAQVYTGYNEEIKSDTAIIVVTGMKINTEHGSYILEDLMVAEGATVKVTESNGTVRTKKTQPSSANFPRAGTYYSADFPVRLDSIYNISITFTNGTVINIENYRLDQSWKRHHYFHSTDGSKSPASVLRKEMDEQTGIWCYVYSFFPFSNYKRTGGNQIK